MILIHRVINQIKKLNIAHNNIKILNNKKKSKKSNKDKNNIKMIKKNKKFKK